jgi:ribosomal protein S18 acetylase RimI-like enzyme
MELVYVGLSRAARGRRLGDFLIQTALHETTAAGLRQLTLAVDQSNSPALRLYYRHGLGEIHRRIAMLKVG